MASWWNVQNTIRGGGPQGRFARGLTEINHQFKGLIEEGKMLLSREADIGLMGSSMQMALWT